MFCYSQLFEIRFTVQGCATSDRIRTENPRGRETCYLRYVCRRIPARFDVSLPFSSGTFATGISRRYGGRARRGGFEGASKSSFRLLGRVNGHRASRKCCWNGIAWLVEAGEYLTSGNARLLRKPVFNAASVDKPRKCRGIESFAGFSVTRVGAGDRKLFRQSVERELRGFSDLPLNVASGVPSRTPASGFPSVCRAEESCSGWISKRNPLAERLVYHRRVHYPRIRNVHNDSITAAYWWERDAGILANVSERNGTGL